MNFDNKTTALVVTDSQNDFLSEDGAAWDRVGDSVRESNTIANLETLLTAARDGYQAAVVNFKFIASKVLTTRETADAPG